MARGQRRAAGAGQQLGGLGCSPRKGAGRAPTAHVTLPQASLSGFLGCNWSCPACEPPCQAEISERGKGEEGLDQVLPPALSALCTAQRGLRLQPGPAGLEPSPSPSPSGSCLLCWAKGPQTPAQQVTMGQRGRASPHSSTEQSLSPAPPLPGPAPTPAPDTVLMCVLGMDPSSTQSLPSSACPAAAGPAPFSGTSIHQTESWLSFLVPGVAVPPAEPAVPKAARLPPMLLTSLT